MHLLQRLRIDARENYILHPPTNAKLAEHPAALNEQTLIKHALENRRDLKAQTAQTEAAHFDIDVAGRTYFPKLDLVAAFAGIGRIYSSNVVNGRDAMPASQDPLLNQLGQQTVGSLMLNLSWDIFDRDITHASVRRSEINEANARIDLDDLSNQVVVEVRQAFADYNASDERFAAASSGTEAAEKAFQLINGRYRTGASSFIDLTTAQAALAQARSLQAQASVNLFLRKRALEFATGDLR